MYVFTIITAFLNGYLVVIQYLDRGDQREYIGDKRCGYMWYCLFFFSRYLPERKVAYVWCNFLFSFLGLGYFLNMWV